MTMPAEVKLMLERKTLELGVTIIGVHSVLMVDEEMVSAIFDIAPDESGSGMLFTFPLPQLVSRNDLAEFAEWLAQFGWNGETLH